MTSRGRYPKGVILWGKVLSPVNLFPLLTIAAALPPPRTVA